MPNQMYLSTLSPDAPALAEAHALGLELDQFCTAVNMDENFAFWDASVRSDIERAFEFVLHAPFAELTPCAIDPMIRDVSMRRLVQAGALCREQFLFTVPQTRRVNLPNLIFEHFGQACPLGIVPSDGVQLCGDPTAYEICGTVIALRAEDSASVLVRMPGGVEP